MFKLLPGVALKETLADDRQCFRQTSVITWGRTCAAKGCLERLSTVERSGVPFAYPKFTRSEPLKHKVRRLVDEVPCRAGNNQLHHA